VAGPVNTVMNLLVPQNAMSCLAGWGTLSCTRNVLHVLTYLVSLVRSFVGELQFVRTFVPLQLQPAGMKHSECFVQWV